ncbi:MAG: hypothetical protein IKR18_11590 [Bacteroidaceae bacterium]|nr:hypothetical protein [Bacteroidaceae bacterium]
MRGIRLTEDMDIEIIDGTVAVGDVLLQNQALILTLHKGELKERPAVGVGISDMLLDHDPLLWKTRIKEQLEMDGQTVNEVRITTSGIYINAEY